jgi:hypothetical protein
MSDRTQHRRDLRYWSDRLQSHFSDLRAERDRSAEGAPIFALEHGLDHEDISALRSLIEDCVGQGKHPPDLSLPLAVFAAEVGYKYAGLEYWLSFEAKIPNWHGDRNREHVRGALQDFSKRFEGAMPKGTWASHFSIICWPITHAILPTDLQRQLARSLFESRGELSRELLDDPASLGQALAARSWRSSGRYQALAENVDLLGLIASALLAENEGSSPFLTRSVLERLVADLASERQAKVWLSGARSAAHKIRIRGVKAPAGSRPASVAASPTRSLKRPITPKISVRSVGEEWQPYLEIPDFAPLLERNPELADEIARRRVVVAGAEQPEASGTLRTPGLAIRLRSWPRTGRALFELEGSNVATNTILADECSLSSGPPWLFRLGSDGVGVEVKGRTVIPSGRYLVILEAHPVASLPSWVTAASLSVGNASAWILNSPPSFQPPDLSTIASFDLRARTEIRIEPVGVTAPSWDGSGHGEWLVGEMPILRIGLTGPTDHILCQMSGEEACFEPIETATGAQVLLSFPHLEAGDHTVSILAVAKGESEPREVGVIELSMRPPRRRLPLGSPREGMAIIAAPANPTLEEIWSGSGLLHVQGPVGVRAKLSLVLLDAVGGPLAHSYRTIRLPITQTDWSQIFDATFRNNSDIKRYIPDASGCRIVVESGQLGEVELECFRRFCPLALLPSERGAKALRVVNNTGDPIRLTQFEFGYPDLCSVLDLPDDSVLKLETGGLIVAEAGSERAAAIFLPELDFDAFQKLRMRPQLRDQGRTVEAVRSLIELANWWEDADLPSDPVAHNQRERVLEAVGQQVWGLLGGSHWRSVERKFCCEDEGLTVADLLNAVGRKDREQAFARGLRIKLNAVGAPSTGDRIRCLAEMLATQGDSVGVKRHRLGFAEGLVHIATAPGRLANHGEASFGNGLRDLFGLSGLFRAVRFVLLTEVDQSVEPEQVQESP